MNAFVKKEIRMVLPMSLLCMALSLSNCFSGYYAYFPNLLQYLNFGISLLVVPALVLIMALNAFGAEMNAGTFSLLLAQPMERARIWRVKTTTLGIALMACFLFWMGCWPASLLFYHWNRFPIENTRDTAVVALLYVSVIYSGALWTVLLFRQVATAFWFTLLIPGALLTLIVTLLGQKHFDEWFGPLCEIIFSIYSLLGFLFARRLFVQAQDIAWTGATLTLSDFQVATIFLRSGRTRRSHRPLAALLRKELMANQGLLLLSAIMFGLHWAVLAMRKFGHVENATLKLILDGFWVVWMVFPIFIGATAISEERKLGTLAAQISLPVKFRAQFWIKFFVVIGLALFLGVMIPLLLEGLRVLPDVHLGTRFGGMVGLKWINGWAGSSSFVVFLEKLNIFLPLLTLTAIAAVLALLSFFASSLCANALQGLTVALAVITAFFALGSSAHGGNYWFHFWLFRGPLIYVIGVPAVLIVLSWLAFRNSRAIRVGWRLDFRNLLMFAAVLASVMASTGIVYHRAWEELTPFEPPHGPARITALAANGFELHGNVLSVILPDGRVWAAEFQSDEKKFSPLKEMLGGGNAFDLGKGHFIPGSDWEGFVLPRTDGQCVGIKKDGTLWLSEPLGASFSRWEDDSPKNMSRLGNDADWKSVAATSTRIVLLKTNGTLWSWAPIYFNSKGPRILPDLRNMPLHRVGNGFEDDWRALIGQNRGLLLVNQDGSIWKYPANNDFKTMNLEPGFPVEKIQTPPKIKWRSLTQPFGGINFTFGISDDGALRIAREEIALYNKIKWEPLGLQIGTETNWVAVTGENAYAVALKKDGTLWLIKPYGSSVDMYDFHNGDFQPSLSQLGSHNDWIGVISSWSSSFALARDGSVWHWPLEPAYYSSGEGNNSESHPTLLDLSRKPQLIGNIFTDLKGDSSHQ